MTLEEGMWVEKYRPQTLSAIVNQKEIIGSLEALIKDPTVQDMPHLLFSGSAGVGKTTTALCLSRQILKEYTTVCTLELNASDERGIEMVREKVKKFSKYAGMVDVPFKIIILDEADRMLDMGFVEDILKIMTHVPNSHQTLMYSATMPPKIRELAKK
ncbi:MAG: DEAD/DEAH box helicase, partial [Nitrosopumilus sp.]